jgi:hypothetical protein
MARDQKPLHIRTGKLYKDKDGKIGEQKIVEKDPKVPDYGDKVPKMKGVDTVSFLVLVGYELLSGGKEEEKERRATPLTPRQKKNTNNETTSKPTQGYGKDKHADEYDPIDNVKKATA